MSSKPAITRASRGVRELFDLDSGDAPSAAGSSSSLSSSVTILILFPEALQRRDAFRHALFPGILRRQRRRPPALLLELKSPYGKLTRLFVCKLHTPCGDPLRNRAQALLVHGLRKNVVGRFKRVDAVDQVDFQIAHVHREFADAVH